LPPEAAAKVAEVESLEVLGASRQLKIIAEAFTELARGYEGSAPGLVETTRGLADYLASTRGASSQAVANAVYSMVRGLESQTGLPMPDLRGWIVERVQAYEEQSQGWMRELSEHGAELLSATDRVLAYDYSSSVAAIFRAAEDRGWEGTVVVPESRSLNGGHKYVRDLRDTKLALEFVPDSAIGSVVSSCGMAIEGAETLSSEGGCYNTVGTFLTALAAGYHDVPFYVASTLIKMDTRTRGGERDIPTLGVDGALLAGWEPELASRVRTFCPDLDYTPPEFIAGFVTEEGVLPPAMLRERAARALGAGGAG
jgi:translation initiation factor 2B subunit (eIF-2B alpha/beta/delta family)